MSRLRQFLSRLHALGRREKAERDLEREMATHLALIEETLQRRGYSPDESRKLALVQFGSRETVKELSRNQRSIPFLEALGRDFRHAGRSLRKAPLLACVALLSLTVAIGANVTIFGLIDAILLRPLPVRDPRNLVVLGSQAADGSRSSFNNAMFHAVAQQSDIFEALVGDSGGGGRPVGLEYNGDLAVSFHYGVTGNFYSSLGIRPLLGRVLTPADDAPPGQPPAPVAVIGYSSWVHRFKSDPTIIGKTIHLEGAPFTIVGVTGKEFSSPDFGLTQHITTIRGALELATGDPDPRISPSRNSFNIVLARLSPGRTIEQARAALESLWPALLETTVPPDAPNPEHYKAQRVNVQPGARGTDAFRADYARPLLMLIAITGLLFLVACLNLANLSRVRAIARQHEMGIRVAIGAGRWTVIRHLLTETLLLSVLGSVAGILLAHWAGPLVAQSEWKGTTAIDIDLSLDWRIVTFTVVLAFLANAMIGVCSVWQAFKTDPAGALQTARTSSPGRSRSMRALIVLQISASVTLLVGAGLFAKTLTTFRTAHFGFQPDGLLTTMNFPQGFGGSREDTHLDWGRYSEELLSGISNLPGVHSAAISLGQFPRPTPIRSKGTAGGEKATVNWITAAYFGTLGVPLRVGRIFDAHDNRESPRVAIINETLARQLGSDRTSMGQRLTVGTSPDAPEVSVVGIVGDVLSVNDIRGSSGNPALLYLPLSQMAPSQQPVFDLSVRSDMAPQALKPVIEKAVPTFGKHYVLLSRTGTETLDRDLWAERMLAAWGTSLALLALALAAVGLYGITSYTVSSRTKEIGIRVALGATRADVLSLFLGQTGLLVVVGLALGVVGALVLGRYIRSFLTGVSANDPITLLSSVLMLGIVGLAAAYIPTRRATAADPLASLRHE